jgi:hypothetical protein
MVEEEAKRSGPEEEAVTEEVIRPMHQLNDKSERYATQVHSRLLFLPETVCARSYLSPCSIK